MFVIFSYCNDQFSDVYMDIDFLSTASEIYMQLAAQLKDKIDKIQPKNLIIYDYEKHIN